MAKSKGVSCVELGKLSRKRSESASQGSWCSEFNTPSDPDEAVHTNHKRRLCRTESLYPEDELMKTWSSSDDETVQPSGQGHKSQSRGKRPKCFSKNAVMARQNRLKKKKYMEDLESELQSLRHENKKLKTAVEGYSRDFKVVRKENLYLRNVLANSSEISQLIRAVNSTTGLPTTSSLLKGARSSVDAESPPHLGSALPSATYAAFQSSCVGQREAPAVRKVKKDFPIAFDDVPLSVSAAEESDELDMLFSCNTSSNFDLSDTLCDIDDLGFGPNALGDWLDGGEALSDIGVCLHVAKKKVSLEFCSSCNENAFSSLDEGISV